MTSLRARAAAGGVIWASVMILIGVLGLASYLNKQTEERFDEALQERHTQLAVALVNGSTQPENIAQLLSNPAYQRVFSGDYWQLADEAGDLWVSPSLVDVSLPVSSDVSGRLNLRTFLADTGESVRAISQWVTLENGARFNVQVARSLAPLEADRRALRQSLTLVFGALAVWVIIGTIVLLQVVLRPIAKLRRDVLARWDDDRGLEPDKYPAEVVPLVQDINMLLERNRAIVDRSRRQAADLAHAIKTPSAILRNALEARSDSPETTIDSLAALDRLDAQLKRALARTRATSDLVAERRTTSLDDALNRLGRAFVALGRNAGRAVETKIDPGLRTRMDQQDLEEVCGNLLDNALKWSERRLRLSAYALDDKLLQITVEDDGPGIPEASRTLVTQGRQRLDESVPGTGLGLSIASDLAQAYGGSLKLEESPDLGGLRAILTLERAGAAA